jgi:argininosuccinate lyase
MDSVATLELVLPAMAGTVATLRFDTARMAAAAPEGFALATEIADWLVRGGVPFREAHEAAGACVRMAEEADCELADLSAEQFARAHPALTTDVRDVLDVHRAIAARTTPNGTAPRRVREQLAAAGERVHDARAWARRNPVAEAMVR